MCHVGLQILQHIANLRDDTFCERVFYPQQDAVDLLRSEGIALGTLETGDPLSCFDVLGVTLQHELTYTTVLSVLELGGIPLLAAERGDDHPLVLGGGPCVCNPEPVAPFFDAFVIGDGEEALGEVLDAVKSSRNGGREAILDAVAAVDGVYVPARHDPATCEIRKRVVQNLDAAEYPTRPLVPWIEVIHDRGQVEVARGCTHGCRFCQAGFTYRPVRERAPGTLLKQAREIIASTGYDELSLVSLNCPDYTGIHPLIDDLLADLSPQGVSIGLPSLRIDTFSVELARKVQAVRKSGFTFAPEAGSQRLRDVINKGVTEQDLLDTVVAAFEAGWNTIKLYFMIGLPTETDEDVLAIAGLVREVAKIGRQTMGKRAGRMKINVSVSNLVPKPHTPLQWDGQISVEEMRRRQGLLEAAIRDHQVRLACHDARMSCLEAALARGDRDTSAAILEAYRGGAVLDAWSDRFDFSIWMRSFEACGMDLQERAMRQFAPDERLPWDHIAAGADKGFLLCERERGLGGELTPDCRQAGCHGCGVNEWADCPLVCGVRSGE
jgi:radical SAM family uncharacterized protein